MDNMGNTAAIIASLLAVIAMLIVVIRWILDSRKNGNKGNDTSIVQSRECYEQHLAIEGKIKDLTKDVSLVNSKLDHIINTGGQHG
jgi:hypothetical protein